MMYADRNVSALYEIISWVSLSGVQKKDVSLLAKLFRYTHSKFPGL